jgi:hypothetical protein
MSDTAYKLGMARGVATQLLDMLNDKELTHAERDRVDFLRSLLTETDTTD